jgi:hypothetical protein
MKALKFILPLLTALVVAAPTMARVTIQAVDPATPADAKAMAIRAAEYLKAQGPETAFAAFSQKGGRFHDRDLYVFVTHESGTLVAHGVDHDMIGTNVLDLKDSDGKSFVREYLAIEDRGWVEYKWEHPLTGTVRNKRSYIVRVGDYSVGVGAYQ